MNQVVDEFLATLTPRTAEAYRRDLDLYLAHIEAAGRSVDDVQRYHLVSFEQTCQRRGDSPATTRRRLSSVRSLHRYLEQVGRRTDSPAEGLVPQPTPRSAGQILRADEVRRCLEEATAPGYQDAGLAMVLFVCYRFRADDAVQLESSSVVRKGPGCTLHHGDGTATMPRPLRQFLPYQPAHAPVGHLLGGRPTPLARQTVGRWVAELGEVAGLSLRVSPRLLLRSAGPIALECGVSPAIATQRDWFALEKSEHPVNLTAPLLAPSG